jgi:hypothetical protein
VQSLDSDSDSAGSDCESSSTGSRISDVSDRGAVADLVPAGVMSPDVMRLRRIKELVIQVPLQQSVPLACVRVRALVPVCVCQCACAGIAVCAMYATDWCRTGTVCTLMVCVVCVHVGHLLILRWTATPRSNDVVPVQRQHGGTVRRFSNATSFIAE